MTYPTETQLPPQKELYFLSVRAWLYKIEEPEEYHHIVLDKCKRDPEALAYFLKHANGEFEAKDLFDKNRIILCNNVALI